VLACFGGQRPQLLDGGVQIAGGPQHRGVDDQAERAELPALAVADVPGQLAAGLLHGELPVHLPSSTTGWARTSGAA
jgi:hypothetical protein